MPNAFPESMAAEFEIPRIAMTLFELKIFQTCVTRKIGPLKQPEKRETQDHKMGPRSHHR
jgi:hypothetical protein